MVNSKSRFHHKKFNLKTHFCKQTFDKHKSFDSAKFNREFLDSLPYYQKHFFILSEPLLFPFKTKSI